MKSAVHDLLPPAVRRSLGKLGADIARARRQRRLTVAMMAERMGVGLNTYARIEHGDGSVAMGAYAMALFVLGFGPVFGDVADARRDDLGLQLDEAQLPKRVRVKKSPAPL
jgi:transcriptional regulator with XRE-family HTH domain